MRVTNLSASVHLMLLGVIFLVVVCVTATALPPPHFVQQNLASKSLEDAEVKLELINTLLEAMAPKALEDQGAYLDAVKEKEVKRALYSGKDYSICRFKLCNMGKRRR